MIRTDNPTIKDLHGNTYKLGDYELFLEFPRFEGIPVYNHVFTRDVITGTLLNILDTENGFYAVAYSSYIKMYIQYKIYHLSYNILEDLRQSHLHGNKYHS